MRFSGVRIAVFFFAVGDSQKQKGLCLLARFLKMPPFGNKKSTCFQSRKQVRGAVFGFGSGELPFPLFNPSANQDNRKHSDRNHSGNPYG